MINTEFLAKCLRSLELSYKLLQEQNTGDDLYGVYRSACVKEFEVILEQSGKLLKKAITPHFSNNKDADKLTFKDIFRFAHKHSLLNENEVLQWFEYRDSRNGTAHEYGKSLADKTIDLVPSFIVNTKSLIKNIEHLNATQTTI